MGKLLSSFINIIIIIIIIYGLDYHNNDNDNIERRRNSKVEDVKKIQYCTIYV